ncbi:hypothetical protein NL676_035877 [Syzygium grande]|nr:hypothetical protein NL676_035877 [Syzygium grande]
MKKTTRAFQCLCRGGTSARSASCTKGLKHFLFFKFLSLPRASPPVPSSEPPPPPRRLRLRRRLQDPLPQADSPPVASRAQTLASATSPPGASPPVAAAMSVRNPKVTVGGLNSKVHSRKISFQENLCNKSRVYLLISKQEFQYGGRRRRRRRRGGGGGGGSELGTGGLALGRERNLKKRKCLRPFVAFVQPVKKNREEKGEREREKYIVGVANIFSVWAKGESSFSIAFKFTHKSRYGTNPAKQKVEFIDTTTMDNKEKLHVAMFPWLAYGHLMPFLEVATFLAQKGHRVSFISTPKNLQKLPTNLPPSITLVELPLPRVPGLPDSAESTAELPHNKVPYLKRAYDMLEPALDELLQHSGVDWIIQRLCVALVAPSCEPTRCELCIL